jgi:hypothetical protein
VKIFFVLLILSFTSLSAYEQVEIDTLKRPTNISDQISSKYQNVAFSQLSTNPEQYDKKVIRLIGYLDLVFEGSSIYPHAEDVVKFDSTKMSVGLIYNYKVPVGLIYNYRVLISFTKNVGVKIKSEKLNDNYVIIEGKFRILHHSWDRSVGTIHITHIKRWTSNDQ